MSRHHKPTSTLLRTALRVLVVIALLGGVGFLSVRGFERVNQPSAEVSASSRERLPDLFDHDPALLVISDSIGGGVGPDIDRYPEVLAAQLGWPVSVDAQGGRGFLPTDLSVVGIDEIVPPFIDTLKHDAESFRADVIIVDGGRNDLGKDPATVAPAIADYFTQLRSYYPKATIVAITPAYVTPAPADNYQQISAAVMESAERIGAYVFDPVAEGWYRDIDLGPLLWDDGVHLNSAGAHYYAQKIADRLRQVGIAPQNDPSREGP